MKTRWMTTRSGLSPKLKTAEELLRISDFSGYQIRELCQESTKQYKSNYKNLGDLSESYFLDLKEYLVLEENELIKKREDQGKNIFCVKGTKWENFEKAIIHTVILINKPNWDKLNIERIAKHCDKLLMKRISLIITFIKDQKEMNQLTFLKEQIAKRRKAKVSETARVEKIEEIQKRQLTKVPDIKNNKNHELILLELEMFQQLLQRENPWHHQQRNDRIATDSRLECLKKNLSQVRADNIYKKSQLRDMEEKSQLSNMEGMPQLKKGAKSQHDKLEVRSLLKKMEGKPHLDKLERRSHIDKLEGRSHIDKLEGRSQMDSFDARSQTSNLERKSRKIF